MPKTTPVSTDGLVPSGGIILWSGAVAAVPDGWFICDGANGTPDLTDSFVIHADADAAGTNNVDDTGGSNTISAGQMPSHTHATTYKWHTGGSGGGTDAYINDSVGGKVVEVTINNADETAITWLLPTVATAGKW